MTLTDEWSHDAVVRYLLHDLEGPALDALEEQLIDSSELQELVAAVETELIDDYVAHRLTPALRARFEARYLAGPAGVEVPRIEFARALRRALPGASIPSWRQRTMRLARGPLAATLVAALALTATSRWWVRRDGDRPAPAAQTEAPPKAIGPVRTEAPPAASPHSDPAPQLSFALAPGGARGPRAGQSVIVPPGARSVRLELNGLAAGNAAYRAVAMTPDGDVVWRTSVLVVRQRGDSLALGATLDLSRLPSGDYVLRVSARTPRGDRQDLADYAFRLGRLAP